MCVCMCVRVRETHPPDQRASLDTHRPAPAPPDPRRRAPPSRLAPEPSHTSAAAPSPPHLYHLRNPQQPLRQHRQVDAPFVPQLPGLSPTPWQAPRHTGLPDRHPSSAPSYRSAAARSQVRMTSVSVLTGMEKGVCMRYVRAGTVRVSVSVYAGTREVCARSACSRGLGGVAVAVAVVTCRAFRRKTSAAATRSDASQAASFHPSQAPRRSQRVRRWSA